MGKKILSCPKCKTNLMICGKCNGTGRLFRDKVIICSKCKGNGLVVDKNADS